MSKKVDDGTEKPRRKSERTRALIRDIALQSFRERGYDDTTIRLIAAEADISVGNASYYFPTKSHLVQELYLDTTELFRDIALEQMQGTEDLVARLRIAYTVGLSVLAEYHRFAPGFLSAAVSPRSPINPLSAESTPSLERAASVFREAVEGAKSPLPSDIAKALPDALMLGYLLLALYWVYDQSPGQAHTFRLLDRGLKLLGGLLPLVRLPLLRGPLREALDLIGEVRV